MARPTGQESSLPGVIMVVGRDATNAFETLEHFATDTCLVEATTIDPESSFSRGFRSFTAPRSDDALPRVKTDSSLGRASGLH